MNMDNNFPFAHFLDFNGAKQFDKDSASLLSEANNDIPLTTDFLNLEKPLVSNSNINPEPILPTMLVASNSIQNTTDLNEINRKILLSLKDLVSPPKYHSYFHEKIKLTDIGESSAEFLVNTNFIKKTIENNYLSALNETLRIIFNRNFNIKITASDSSNNKKASNNNQIQTEPLLIYESSSAKEEENKDQSPKITSVKDARFTIDLYQTKKDLLSKVDSVVLNHLDNSEYGKNANHKKTFENFVVGSSNNMAYTSTITASKNPGKAYPTLYLHSGSGLGKTHLLHAIINNIQDLFPELKTHLITARDFMREMCDAMATKKISNFRKKYTEQIDVLIVDDVHELKNKQGTQNELFHVLNELHGKYKQLVFSADRPPNEIDGIDDRIKARLSWGLIVDLQKPDVETRVAILKKKAMDEDIFLSDDVIFFIANTIKDNIRELEGALIRLGAYSSIMQMDIDLEMAREQLSPNIKRNPETVTIDKIIYSVSRYFKITSADIKSKSRNKNITLPRHIAMYLSNKHLDVTFKEIGLQFSNRDHTSVIHAVEKIKENLKVDKDLMQTVVTIEKTL
ncbi:MAG: chromosomal replication initiator protein DnaA [Oligoflexia bacterium]|nr:chromosomal replication initiator protein DnaA [Oligoflexia bacterium]